MKTVYKVKTAFCLTGGRDVYEGEELVVGVDIDAKRAELKTAEGALAGPFTQDDEGDPKKTPAKKKDKE